MSVKLQRPFDGPYVEIENEEKSYALKYVEGEGISEISNICIYMNVKISSNCIKFNVSNPAVQTMKT